MDARAVCIPLVIAWECTLEWFFVFELVISNICSVDLEFNARDYPVRAKPEESSIPRASIDSFVVFKSVPCNRTCLCNMDGTSISRLESSTSNVREDGLDPARLDRGEDAYSEFAKCYARKRGLVDVVSATVL